MIRTLKEAAAACGIGEKEKKGQCCEGAADPLVFFYGTAQQLTTRNASPNIERGEKKKHGFVFADILYVTKYDIGVF